MPNTAFSTGKPYGHGSAMTDAYGHVVREGDEVLLLQSSIKHARYIVDEINGHIAYLRPRTDTNVSPFPVLAEQILKVKHRQFKTV